MVSALRNEACVNTIPHDGSLDSTLALLRDGYDFIGKRSRRLQSDIFATRLMQRRAVCMVGEDAARAFYHPGRFTRRGAIPPTTLRLLQDKGSVQLLDGEAHRLRKAMFLETTAAAAMPPGGVKEDGNAKARPHKFWCAVNSEPHLSLFRTSVLRL